MDARAERRDISYDDLMALPYLDAVCKETLRLCVNNTIVFHDPLTSSVAHHPDIAPSLSCISCECQPAMHLGAVLIPVEKASQRYLHSFIATGDRKRWPGDRLHPRTSGDNGRCGYSGCEQRPRSMGTGCGPVDSRTLASTSARSRD